MSMWAALVFSSVAVAQEPVSGLVWRWEEGQHRRFLASADVELVEPLEFNGLVNTDNRIGAFKAMFVLDCAATTRVGKAAWELTCDIDAASVVVTPIPSHRGKCGPVAEEWARQFDDVYTVVIVQTADGRLRDVSLRGTNVDTDRFQRIGEWQRQMLLRALAPLDVHLPKKGEVQGEGWFQKAGMAMAYPSFSGGIGSYRWAHALAEGAAPPMVSWIQQAEGTIQPGGDGVETAMMTLSLKLDGSATFDTSAGQLVQASYFEDGYATASSVQAEAGRNGKYTQTSFIQLLGDEVPMLPASGER